MASNEKYQLKLAPLQDVNVSSKPLKSALKKSSEHRLNGGCTTLMYACQHGHTETIIKELRSQVTLHTNKEGVKLYCYTFLLMPERRWI